MTKGGARLFKPFVFRNVLLDPTGGISREPAAGPGVEALAVSPKNNSRYWHPVAPG